MTNATNKLLSDFSNTSLEDEDGGSLQIVLRNPTSELQLQRFEESIGTSLPPQLRELFEVSNGLGWFGVEVLSISELLYYREQGIIPFHSWGNGDFDCIATKESSYQEGAVLFMNHSPEVLVAIESSLVQWMRRIADEIAVKHAVLHPSDYRTRREQGVYDNVLRTLSGVSCELNS